MKFLCYYVRYEFRRKPRRFWILASLLGAVLFCLISLAILLASHAAAGTAASSATTDLGERRPLASLSFKLIALAHGALSLICTALLTAQTRREDKQEYQTLQGLGVTKTLWTVRSILEHTLVLLSAAIVAAFASVGVIYWFSFASNRKVGESELIFTIPAMEVAMLILLLLMSVIIGTLLGNIPTPQCSVRPIGLWKERVPVMLAFRKICHRRQPLAAHLDRASLCVLWLLPLIFALAALSFGNLTLPTYDCTVLVDPEVGRPIPEELVTQLRQVSGIISVETLSGHRPAGEYSAIRLTFSKETREASLSEIPALVGTDYLCQDVYHTTRQTNAWYSVMRIFFGMLAGILFVVALAPAHWILIGASARYDHDLLTLHTLGIERAEIDRFLSYELYTRLGVSAALSIVLSAIAFAVMETEGGGGLYLAETAAMAGICLLGQSLLVIWSTGAVKRRFWKEVCTYEYSM